ncbi:hypothetical protein [Nocardioides marmoriginsengisoli]|uniref:hypothetical protein n=1 Tax=Nocardioides marmoriginsengisoli TaxID=661483 RepID=UPI0011CDCB4E|nr:hypothetical protein [Nocardioides marmoriginsengisoli]
MNPAKLRSLGLGLPTSDDYPGTEPVPGPRPSRFDEDGKCTWCEHNRDQKGEQKCGVKRGDYDSCWCPYGRNTP